MIELIVNVSDDWGIGIGNELFVSIRADLKHFREYTIGKTVILGRKTLQTFPGGKPLNGRRNLILSNDNTLEISGAEVVHGIDELFSSISPNENCIVVGGESIYRLLLPYCSRAIVTKTSINLLADRFFPNLDELENWQVESNGDTMEENDIRFRYVSYININPLPIPYEVK